MTSVDDFASDLMAELKNYSQDITDGMKKSIDVVGKEVNATIKEHVTFKGSGAYVKSFRIAKTSEDFYSKTKTWYVADPHYRLTHLLENGHAMPQGGRSKAYPHIKYGADLAEKRMLELSKEAVENARR